MFFLPPDADAQLDKGFLAGWNRTDWDFQVPGLSDDIFEPKNGFCAGLFVAGNVSGVFGWRGEILYTRKGALAKSNATDENGQFLGELNTFYNVDYLEIPLLATFTIPTGGAVEPVLFLGPALDFELSAEMKSEYPSGVSIQNNSTEDLDDTRSSDYSLIFGAGVDIVSGPHLIMLQVRYVLGLEEVYFSAKNKTLSVVAGFGI
jgi:hypothetical protein